VNRLKPSHLSGALVAAGLLTAAVAASASDALDPALERLVVDQRCHGTNVGNGDYGDYMSAVGGRGPNALGRFNDDPATLDELEQVTGRRGCTADNAAFMRLVNQWGFALAPTAMHTAHTLGYGGFHFSIEALYTKIEPSAYYWKMGSRGERDPSSNTAAPFNNDVPGMVQQYSARVRKGLGFGLEVAGQVGFVPNSSMYTGGADVRLALLEGFRTGVLGILPDLSVGAGVRSMTGASALQLTTAGLDVQISKPLPLANQSVLTPRIGYQYVWIYGNSRVVDTTPATDALGYCGFTGSNTPANRDPAKPVSDGQPVCAGGQPTDANNNVVFSDVRLQRHRMIFGVDYRYEFMQFGFQFITDIVDPAAAQSGNDTTLVYERTANNRLVERRLTDRQILRGIPRQFSLVFQIGAQF